MSASGTRVTAIVASAVAIGFGAAVCVGPAAAAVPTRLALGGTQYVFADKLPSIPLIDRYLTRTADQGLGFYPGSSSVVVHYPASVFARGSIGEHIGIGTDNLDAAIRSVPGPLVAVGESEGSMVLNAEQVRLESDLRAPGPDRLAFIMFNDPQRGLLNTVFRDGTRIPLVGITVATPIESRYNTTVVVHEYDAWGDFPDRPWNVPALANAVMGGIFVHSLAEGVPADLAPGNVTTRLNSKGATETTYFVPTGHLPLYEPLRIAGVPEPLVDTLDAATRPIIDRAYSRNDAPGDPRPYLDHGVIRSNRGPAPGKARVLAGRGSLVRAGAPKGASPNSANPDTDNPDTAPARASAAGTGSPRRGRE